ncbi:hypothetical protein F0562_034367 [Nyssa sinensis]|uniref:NB-ARC domain-containing protein n=1 Tax=Nyssa sinensis TaxID=561372 RepID=A0A5J5AHZ0_9ASTE|nr:hypothetical protein F0562_034367 [Nyssa sinensis]
MADTAIDFFLLNLKQLKGHQLKDYRFPLTKRNIIVSLYEDLRFLRSFLRDSEQKRNEHTEVKDLASQIIDLALDAEDIIDSLIVAGITLTKRNIVEKSCHLFYPQRTLRDVIKEVESIKTVVRNIYEQKLYGMGVGQVEISSHGDSSRAIPPTVEEEFVVGFDQEAEEIKDRLTGSSEQQLQVISIVGMAGSGKTTLARKLYNDHFILYHFYIRAWTYVSQAYRKRDLLLGILCSVVEHTEGIYRMSDEKLGEELYRRLKGRRYLVVMDDIWHIDAWNDLKRSFPDDNNGSRIMFTTRIKDVALHAQPDCPPHSLLFLSEDESWNLLQRKVFLKESCPPALVDIGKLIAEKCRGLPLAIVVIAGLLAKTEKTKNWWNQVAESVSSYIVSDTEQQCMNTLALSYNHLPLHLKSCFLYFGAFPEDYEISVRKLTWLWIAEGFIQKIGEKDLEDVAEEYLMELIDRSLVLVAKTRASGGIRACRVHDLLRDLCLRKAQEEIFLQQIYKHEEFCSSSSSPIAKNQRRLSICSFIFDHITLKFSILHIRSLLYFASEQNSLPPKHMSINYGAFKLLRVSDLSAIRIPDFPNQILQLVLLRYLALRGKYLSVPESIYKLFNLETLIVSESIGDLIPTEIWTMKKLRHLCIAGENSVKSASLPPLILYNLKTMAQIQPLLFESGQKLNVFERTPNLQTLGFCGNLTSAGFLMLPDLSFLHRLETLKLFNKYNDGYSCKFLEGYEFPLNLKRLTLSKTALEWKEMSTIGMLPNLESLKLEFQACVGRRWDTSDGGFRQLKFLRFYCINIKQWNASSIHFPRLEHLVLQRSGNLEEIPSELGDISTLQIIEIIRCSQSLVNSALQIQEEQQSNGNDYLKVLIYRPDWVLTT